MFANNLNEAQFIQAVKDNDDYAVLVLDPNGIITTWNSGAEKMKGYTADEVIGQSFSIFFSADDRLEKTPEKLLRTAVTQGKSRTEGWRYTKNGRRFWANSSLTPIYLEKEVVGFIKITSDMGDLRETRQKFERIFDSDLLAVGISEMDSGKMLEVNQGFEKLFGFTKEEVVGKTGIEMGIWGPEMRDLVFDILRSKRKVSNFELKLTGKGGKVIHSVCTLRTIEVSGKMRNIFIVNDITDLKLNEQKLAKSQVLFQTIFERNPTAMCITNVSNGIFVQVNDSFLKHLGYTRDEVIGKNPHALNLYGLDQHNHLQKVFEETGSLYNEQTRIQTKSGDVLDILFSTEIIDVDGEMRALSTFNDVSAQRKLELELVVAKEEAESAARMQEEFLANMSHEIRTPLSAIIGFSEILNKHENTPEDQDLLRIVNDAGTSLLRIINDILDISKLESGSVSFETNPLDIRQTLHSIEVMLSQKAQDKGLNLSLSIDDRIPNLVGGDQARLSQILINLMGNAIKFTHSGSVQVKVKLDGSDELQHRITFEVIDTGIGIPEHKKESIFHRFKQAESSTSREYGGTGLGLSIVKRLIEMQGGTLSVLSEIGTGSTFIFTLPFLKNNASSVAVENEPNALLPEGLKVLLVEDNMLNVKLLQHILKDHQVCLHTVFNGAEALYTLKNNSYDVILMDIQMPLMDGYQATKEIRQNLQLQTPIIAMTANAMPGERDKCLALGMTDYLSKPIDTQLLKRKINSVLVW